MVFIFTFPQDLCTLLLFADPDTLPLLQELNTEPTVHLSPQFSSEVYTYQATVSFDNMVLQIWGKVSNCHLNVRINTKYEDNQ